jgi:hypothetical protein
MNAGTVCLADAGNATLDLKFCPFNDRLKAPEG